MHQINNTNHYQYDEKGKKIKHQKISPKLNIDNKSANKEFELRPVGATDTKPFEIQAVFFLS